MRSSRKPYLEICLTFERREDGGLRVYSEDVPELLLSHPDSALVAADVAPALATILSEKFGRHVTVGELGHIRDEPYDDGVVEPRGIAPLEHKRYVADFEGP